MRAVARRETRALLRAHLSAAVRYRHRVRHCAVCAALHRLAVESSTRRPERAEDIGDESPSNA
ncbi:DUF6274 family protein [Streptomyces uncialis]|uniref:DUF6274 family protein n=1 Tax=Streptomyces uncialis TaxID=1048205 RepID=UPI00093A36EA|nr:DUF6274 family protein [Streptomyces uncialis]MCX4661219.1 DUF6274 family protein [Streptomyces uncialis]WST69141.1 DUF6274 family protein [Streptomyces uncialis]WTE12217.1 DUF6274 family protein [Streptomyces uncialis]